MSFTTTPQSNRLHIGIYGKTNSGKSSLINAITGQKTALVSEVAGTTTDPVYKAMEIHGIGPCVFIDTAGFDDTGKLGQMRIASTRNAVLKTDVALLVFADADIEQEGVWIDYLREHRVPIVAVINKADILAHPEQIAASVRARYDLDPLIISTVTGQNIGKIREAIIRRIPEDYEIPSITDYLVGDGDVVLLVMPQDIQAPKGRLILPQVQTIRDLLDHKCLVFSCTTDKLDAALAALSAPPKLIITDSQVFATVYEKKPAASLLTSFSVLFARYKGDLPEYVRGANAIDTLSEGDRVLIAEACTHAPLAEDIGREKIPRMLKKKIGPGLRVDVVSGTDFPDDLTPYALIIHCGACMFNRKYVLSRIESAKAQGVPISNYGVVIAKLTGILDKISLYG